MKPIVFLLLAFLAAIPTLSVAAQQTASPGNGMPAQPAERQVPALTASPAPVPTRSLSLNVVVTDKSGQPVSGLQAGDFKLLDNKQPQNLLSVEPANGMTPRPDPPVEAIILIDGINTNFSTISSERQWIETFFKSNGGELPLPTSLAVLTDQKTAEPTPPSRDGHVLLNLLDNNPNGLRQIRRSEGYWGAVDRNQLSLQSLLRLTNELARTPGRKLLIWISPGWAAFSRQSWFMSEKDEQGLYSGIVQISTALREADVTLYSVDPLGAAHPQFYYETFLKGVDSPKHVDYGDLMLQVIAVQSGGMVLFGDNYLSELIDRCVADAKSYYILTYQPARADRPNEYHAIQVQVDKPGLKARTRTGYYAQP